MEPTPIAVLPLSQEDLDTLRRAKEALESPSLTMKLASVVGSPIEKLMARMPNIAQEKIDDATVKLSAEADWLVCEKICIPGSANLALTLPRSTTSAAANAELFDRYRKLLPQGSIAPDLTIGQTRRGSNDVTVAVKSNTFASYAFADFYPLPDQKTVVGHPKTVVRSSEITITVPFENQPPDPLRGLLVLAQTANDHSRVGLYISNGDAVATTNLRLGLHAATTRGFDGPISK